MANGDDAAAAGIPVMTGLEDRRLGYDEINLTRDEIARRTSLITPIAKGGTGADTASEARTALGITPSNIGAEPELGFTPVGQMGTGNRISMGWSAPHPTIRVDNTVMPLQRRDTDVFTAGNPIGTAGGRIDTGGGFIEAGGGSISGGDFNSATAYGRNVSGAGVRAMYVSSAGQIGISTSSRRYKRILNLVEADPLAILDLAPVYYQYLHAVETDGDDAYVEAGLIAEDLHDAGLGWLVYYDDQERPEGIAYERFALAVLIATRYVWEQHKQLDARVAALEAANNG